MIDYKDYESFTSKKEEWKRFKTDGIESNYEISSYGNVRNIVTGKQLRVHIDYTRGGYPRVALSINGKDKHYSVHRLVALTFIPNPDPENKPQVNHIDGVKTNNCVDNLEWVSFKENIEHAMKTGLKPSHDEKTIRKVCKMLEKGKSIYHIAKKLNVTTAFVSGIKYNGNWNEIRSEYNIPKFNTYGDRSKEQNNMIDELLKRGLRSKKEILQIVGLPDTKANINYIKWRIRDNNYLNPSKKKFRCKLDKSSEKEKEYEIEEEFIFGYELNQQSDE